MSHKNNIAKLAGALLVTTAFTAPAYAEIETVVVTAERKAEDIQSVPVAVTALTGADLKAKQVNTFRDLQFHVPSVTYTKSNFGGAQFQIRGITTQFGLGAAIAQNVNNVYIEAPALVNGQYYDVERVEVARGPQSTSYGRAATGGAVNIITNKPNLDEFQARVTFDYGTFNTMKPEVMVNIPIIEGELGVRFAALGVFHDGYEKNNYAGPVIYPTGIADRVNSQGTAGGRLSVRWQPNADTTIDLSAEVGYENDRRVRGDKQMCHRDPSGVVGCLPDALGFDSINTLSTLGSTLGSKQGLTALLNLSFGVPFANAQVAGNAQGLFQLAGNGGPGDPAGPAGAAYLGVTFTAVPGPYVGVPVAPGFSSMLPQTVNGLGSGAGGVVTPDILTSNTAFKPVFKGAGGTYTFNWSQTITSWLKSEVDVGYINGYQFTQQNYNNATPENISTLITSAVAGFNALHGAGANAGGAYNTYFNVPGALPITNTNYGGKFGSYAGSIDTTRGGILTRTSYNGGYDQDYFSSREWTGEVRLSTAFDGPMNFTAGAFWMSFDSRNQYWVAANGLDWESIVIGAFAGDATKTPLMLASTSFDSEYRRGSVQSRSAFVEMTYDIIPDTLRFIAGARYNDDRSSAMRTTPAVGGLLLTNGFAVVGSPTCGNSGLAVAAGCVGYPMTYRTPTGVTGQAVNTTDLWTGRMTLNWTPKLSWTDQTLVYATMSRGELAGGLNTSNNSASLVIPLAYNPATVDALEIGTKNTLLDGTLQANLDFWYYNYENYQVGIIANRQALTLNIPAHLFGMEGEFVWQPQDDLAFNLTMSLTQSGAGTAWVADQRNPTAGQAGAILVKDMTNGSNCVIVPTSAAASGHTPGESNPAFHVNNFYLPNGGNAAIDAPFGIPLVNYGVCQTNAPGAPMTATRTALIAAGFDYAPATSIKTGAAVAGNNDGTGIPVNLHGNELPQVPNAQIGIGAQYTYHWDEYTLVPRLDYYWQSSMWARVWNDNPIDKIGAWDTMNLQLQLNAPDNKWYARVFATNVFDKHNPTGVYLTDPTSALFTNVFSMDPRVIGVSVGANW